MKKKSFQLDAFFDGTLYFLYFLLSASFFLTLGSDEESQLFVRYILGFVLAVVFFLRKGRSIFQFQFARLSLWVWLLLVVYQVIRAVLSPWIVSTGGLESVHLTYYRQAPLIWMYLGLFIVTGFHLFFDRTSVHRLLWFFTIVGFMLALSAIPPLMQYHQPYYQTLEPGRSGYFPPFIYFHPWVAKYLIGKFAHSNYTGDVIAIGFFSALGIGIYHFEIFREESVATKQQHKRVGVDLERVRVFLSPLLMAVVMGASILLLFSRGTILTMTGALLFFSVMILFRFRSKTLRQFVFMTLLGLIGFSFWAGNLPKVFKEMQTLKNEFSTTQTTSFSMNREGADRAWAMFKDHFIWGVGTGGYKELALKYASQASLGNSLDLARHTSLCHYLQLLAEEGVGAFLYFAFILVYALTIFFRLWNVKSRFQYITSLALFTPVLMLLSHASFNHLMERVSMAALFSILVGVSLGALRKDFDQTPTMVFEKSTGHS